MIDFHSHVLPAIDDGSRDAEQSIQMLQMLRRQGAEAVVATPHFYADRISVAGFLERRNRALERLQAVMPADAPALILGAEVQYYEGISRLEDLDALRMQNSQLLLLEMPVEKWSEHTVRELLYLSGSSSFQIAIAHVERCVDWRNRKLLDRLVENGILLQANASVFLRMWSGRRALSELKNNRIHLLGSDCHNLTSRAPRLGEAYEVIEHKYGPLFVRQMDEFACSMFSFNKL